MNAFLRLATAMLAIAALVLAVASFAPLPLDDFARFTMRVAALGALGFAYIAFEARNVIRSR